MNRPSSVTLAATADSPLGRVVADIPGADPSRSAVLAIDDGRDAFVTRAVLADAATTSLDLQYYIWNNDRTGQLLLEHLWRAGQRGVRVRLLLDDNNSARMEALLARVSSEPNIQVRLFNPFAHRGGLRVIDFLTDFGRVNRRMHDKAFIADGLLAVTGGRNIGDEYFAAGSAMSFADLDVLLAGAIVPQISASFDAFWNSASAYDVGTLVPPPEGPATDSLEQAFEALHDDPQTASYLAAVRASRLTRELQTGTVPMEWTDVRLVADRPDKVLGAAPGESIPDHLVRAMGVAASGLDLVSPYFVPTASGTAALIALRQRGVRVRVLTNSLAATDVAVVHAGYARWRKPLLLAGVDLYELKAEYADLTVPGRREDAGSGALIEGPVRRMPGSSGSGVSGGSRGSRASLHAKTFGVDGKRVYVGSFNFDPRSARFNTELGVVIDSPEMAAALAQAFETVIPRRAYSVQLDNDGDSLVWIEHRAADEKRYTTEPETSFWQRLGIGLLSLLPLDGWL